MIAPWWQDYDYDRHCWRCAVENALGGLIAALLLLAIVLVFFAAFAWVGA